MSSGTSMNGTLALASPIAETDYKAVGAAASSSRESVDRRTLHAREQAGISLPDRRYVAGRPSGRRAGQGRDRRARRVLFRGFRPARGPGRAHHVGRVRRRDATGVEQARAPRGSSDLDDQSRRRGRYRPPAQAHRAETMQADSYVGRRRPLHSRFGWSTSPCPASASRLANCRRSVRASKSAGAPARSCAISPAVWRSNSRACFPSRNSTRTSNSKSVSLR